MLIHIPHVLSPAQVDAARTALDAAGPSAWIDGRVTAGHQGAAVKRNLQIAENSPLALDIGDMILAALECNPLFISAALPNQVYPPLFNRYEPGMQFGSHVDGAIRIVPGSGAKLRTDLSATLFLSAPDEYQGGELLIEDTYGMHSIKLAAGDLILYPATSLHRVCPIQSGMRIASFFWIQSLVPDVAQRTLLYEMDSAIQQLNSSNADTAARTQLTGCYHNLLRMWSIL
jgi:PKHD-type hydroxylase